MGKTHKNQFTNVEMECLRGSPYVRSVSASTIRFTEEFKRSFYQKHQSGMSLRQIFLEHGIDPDILGESRIKGFRYTLNKCAKREEGFADKQQENYRRTPKAGEESVETRLKQLEHELAYTRQEVEFLKNCKWQIWRRGDNGNPGSSRNKVCPDI